MNRRDDDRFRPKVGPPKARGGKSPRFVSRVLRVAGEAGPVVSRTLARPRSARGAARGRGQVAARFAGQGLGPRARRVVIKTRLVVLKAAGPRSTETHLRYIQRDGVTREGQPGQVYSASEDRANASAFEARGRGDRHQFRFIVASEDAEALDDLRTYTRGLMARVESDLGTRLDWIAVDHWDTEHPHAHVVLRGKDASGADLVIARDYISHGMRRRAGEIATEWLGPRTEREIDMAIAREVTQARWTSLDRALRELAVEGAVDLRAAPAALPLGRHQRLLGRARHLETLGLAEPRGRGVWALRPEAESTLRALGERGDIVRAMQSALGGERRELVIGAPPVHDESSAGQAIVGRVIDKGLRDELHEAGYLVVDALDGRAHYVALPAATDLADVPLGGVVEVRASGGGRASDRAIAAVADRGLYRTEVDRLALRRGGLSEERAAAVIEGRVRRLEALRRAGAAERIDDEGTWRVPPDVVARGARHDRGRDGGLSVVVRSDRPIERQVRAVGATWLDTLLIRGEAAGSAGFGAAVREALREREAFLAGEGLAQRRGTRLVLARDLLATLRRRDLGAAASVLAGETGLSYREAVDGQAVAGIYRRSVTLASGRFAMLDDGQGFTLVPWRPVIEPRLGQWVGGVTRSGSVSWRFDRQIDLAR